MRRTIIIFLGVAAVLSGCAQLKREPSAPICDGKHRRPANVHGSVLMPTEGGPEPIGPSAAAANLFFARCDA